MVVVALVALAVLVALAALAAIAIVAAVVRRRRMAATVAPRAPAPGRLAPRPTPQAPAARRLELPLSAGRLAARAWGSSGELVLCLPGLAATSGTFAAVAPALAERHRVVALDLRGRGRSEATPPGSYGWEAHARDVLEAASLLGADRFAAIGHSMGAYVAMQAAALAPRRLARVVLIDSAGRPDHLAASRLLLAVRGLTTTRGSVEEHAHALRAAGVVQPWSDVWEQALLDDLVASSDGVRRRTSGAAVKEDVAHAITRRPRELWDALDMPVLLVRATRPITRMAGFVVPARERDAMSAHVPDLRVVEVAANHFGVLTHPDTVAAIHDFLGPAGAPTAADTRGSGAPGWSGSGTAVTAPSPGESGTSCPGSRSAGSGGRNPGSTPG
jgi:pimeloyl-ACP methyl ester carboxylesterase